MSSDLDVEPGGFEARPRAASHLNHREEGAGRLDTSSPGGSDYSTDLAGAGGSDYSTDLAEEEGPGGFEARPRAALHLNHRDDVEEEFGDFDESSVSLFEGDEGGLEYGQRQALVALLKQRFISARTHPRDWQVLVENERVLRSRLNDLFLDLQIDRAREVAWKRQASGEGGGRFPTLLHDTSWSREETLVLVHLRDRLRAGIAGGDLRVFVDRDDILDYVASYRPVHATDESGDEKRARNAVASVAKSGLLIATGSEERFEISEAVEPLLPLELLQELLEALRAANGTEVVAAEEAGLFEGGDGRLDTSSPGGSDYSTNLGGGRLDTSSPSGSDYSTNLGGGRLDTSSPGGSDYSTNLEDEA